LYTFVDGQLFPVDAAALVDNEAPRGYVHEWEFKLAVAFPRSEVPCVAGRRVGDVDALRGGANLVVEGFERGDESDGSDN
jgi:FAS-associated factor 2